MTISTFDLAAWRIEVEIRYMMTGHDELAGWSMMFIRRNQSRKLVTYIKLRRTGVGVVSIRAMLLGMTEGWSTAEEGRVSVTQRAAITSG
jgi:hypothetical protein